LGTITELKKAINTTKNFWILIPLRIFHGTRSAHFRNGIETELNISEYLIVISLLEYLRKEGFTITKTIQGYFLQKINGGISFQTLSLVATPAVFELVSSLVSQGWTFEQNNDMSYYFHKNGVDCLVQMLDDNLFSLKLRQVEIIGPYDSIWIYLFEITHGVYDWNFNGKVVLDVGGFCGETAVFFASQGAKKVIIYEPVPEHQKFIKENMIRNNIEAEIHEEGIGEKDGTETIRCWEVNPGFGLERKEKKELKVKIRSVTDVIETSGADIGKFDCEGAEASLLNVPESTLRKIDFYIIETHSLQIRNAIVDKFSKSGFKPTRAPKESSKKISILYFEKEL